MGAYLSQPVRDKIVEEGVGKSFSFGAASMQGWRTAQEDAHNCCPQFDENTDTSLFAVYDGHGGAEVAQYMASKFPDFLRSSETYKNGNLEKALEESFLGFDAQLTKPEVVEILQEIAGLKADNDENDLDETEEARMLFEEADMPVDKVLARFKAQKQAILDALDTKASEEKKAKSANGDSEAVDKCADKLSNGSGSHHDVNGSGDNKELVAQSGTNGSNTVTSAKASSFAEADGDAGSSGSSKSQNDEAGLSEGSAAKFESQEDNGDGGSSSASASIEGGSSSGSLTRRLLDNDEEDEETSDSEEDEDGEDWHAKMAADVAAGDDDDDDDEEEEDEEEDDDDDEDTIVSCGGEEPGADSGCTAVVALMRNKQLVVANAGDSRCVLCRGGQAVEMSFDHKPESPVEEERIKKAGGCITADGRVNGGLNLSRAIGDHSYKKNTSLPLHEQMISALPDLQTTTLTDDDEFIVLACDGIWNMMSSQEVVTFVRERLQAGQTQLTTICEEMFDYCLAPDTLGDGTGCDNMTAIIVLLRPPPSANDSTSPAAHSDATCMSNKRSLDFANEDASDESSAACKRAKVDAEETAAAAESISN